MARDTNAAIFVGAPHGAMRHPERNEKRVVPTLVGLLAFGTPRSKNSSAPLKWELRTDFRERRGLRTFPEETDVQNYAD